MGRVSPDWLAYVLSKGDVIDKGILDIGIVSSDQFVVTHVQGVSLSENAVLRSDL